MQSKELNPVALYPRWKPQPMGYPLQLYINLLGYTSLNQLFE